MRDLYMLLARYIFVVCVQSLYMLIRQWRTSVIGCCRLRVTVVVVLEMSVDVL